MVQLKVNNGNSKHVYQFFENVSSMSQSWTHQNLGPIGGSKVGRFSPKAHLKEDVGPKTLEVQ